MWGKGIMEELYVDLKAYGKSKKWMWFELFARQPIALFSFMGITMNCFLSGNNVKRTWFMAIVVVVWITLAVMTIIRKKYSYSCWIALLILQTAAYIMNGGISFWRATISEIILVFLIAYYNNRKDFFYKEKETCETKDCQGSRKWEINLIIIIHLVFACCMHFFLGNVSDITSMRVYDNTWLAMLGWFLYGTSLCLTLKWEKIVQLEWRQAVFAALGAGMVTVTARIVLDHMLDTILLDTWNQRGIMRASLIITGIFCLALIRILFAIFTEREKNSPTEAHMPIIIMAVIAILYLVEYTFSCGWVEKEDLEYAYQVVLPVYVWSSAYFIMIFWALMRMRCVNKSDSIKKEVTDWLGRTDGFGQYILKGVIKFVIRNGRNIWIIVTLALLVVGIASFDSQQMHMPIWLTYPYDVTIEGGGAVINAYVAQGKGKEVNVPQRIWGIKVKRIEDDAFRNEKVHIVSLSIPEEFEFDGEIFHYESQSYYYLAGNGVWLAEYIGKEKNVKIPEEVWGRKVTGLYAWCFQESDIEEVTIPDTVTYISSMAFEGCQNLTKVKLSSNLEEISVGAFEGTGIRSITIPKSVKSIEESAFKNSKLVEVIGIDNVGYVDPSAFVGTPWEERLNRLSAYQ